MDLGAEVDRVATETSFSGVVRLDRAGTTVFERAYGMAHRGLGVPNTVDTRFAIASGTKAIDRGWAVMALVEDGHHRAYHYVPVGCWGADLPLIDDAVTVEQLLAPSLPASATTTARTVTRRCRCRPRISSPTEDFRPILDGYPMVFPPGTDFCYNNRRFRRAGRSSPNARAASRSTTWWRSGSVRRPA